MTDTPPTINQAADALVQALDGMEGLRGFREGLQPQIRYLTLTAEMPSQHQAEAGAALTVWTALGDLAAAVLARREKENDHG